MTAHFGVAGPETEAEFQRLIGRRPERRLAREAPNGLVVRCDILSFRMLYNHPDRASDVGGAFAPEACWFTYHNYAPPDSIHIIDNGDENGRGNPARRADVLSVLDQYASDPLGIVAFFCHGWPNGMQFGFDLASLPTLVASLAAKSSPNVRIALYACETGASPEEGELEVLRRNIAHERRSATDEEAARQTRLRAAIAGQAAGEGGFAFALRDQLVATNPGCQVFAHITLGHSTRNPEVRGFAAPAGSAGVPVVAHTAPPRGRDVAEADRAAHELWSRWSHTLAHPFDGERPSSLLWRFPTMTTDEVRAHLDALYAPDSAAR